ncbi:MAG: hypothetical protein VB035_02525 [Candidatus Fimivivens sp.]|nr:hypothetical protein [Candidatus Fimivivens sp.]
MLEVEQEILNTIITQIEKQLLYNKMIDQNRINDRDYVLNILKNNINEIMDICSWTFDYNDTLVSGIKNELENDRKISAIILAGTYLEHILNSFYVNILSFKFDFSNTYINDAIKASSIIDKISWFFELVTRNTFNKALYQEIKKINSIRNQLVHYKPIGTDINTFFDNNQVYKNIDQISLTLVSTLDSISIYLTEIEKSVLINEK